MRAAAIRSLHPVAALVSAGTTAAILAALIGAGILSPTASPEPRALTVVSLAAPRGSDASDAKAQPAEPRSIAASRPADTQPQAPVPAQHRPVPLATPPLPATLPAPTAASAPATASAAPASAPAPPSTAGAMITASAPAAAPRGVHDGLAADAPSGSSRAYAARVRSWLLSHKIYPRYARMRRIEGHVRVRFVLDRQGRLVEGVLGQSSGERSLDAEGEAMLRRASPFPPAPADIAGERIGFTAVIAFELTD